MLIKRVMVLVFLVCMVGVPVLPVHSQTGPHLMASFSILADVAQAVAGDTAVVDTLIPVGQDPHSFQPTPKAVVELSKADAVLIVGINFEENLLPVLTEAAGDRIMVVSECVPVRLFGDTQHETTGSAQDRADIAEQCAAHHTLVDAAFTLNGQQPDPGASVGMVYEGVCGADGHDHEAGSCDPHVWMDPVNVALWTLMIRDTLIKLDPGHAEIYTANADAYLAQLIDLDHEIDDSITSIPEANRYIVTNHLAFNYLAARYGLQVVGTVIPGGSTGAEPSTQDIVRLIETIQEFGVPAIFTETTVSANLADQIANETGAEVVRLYTGSLSGSDEPASTYLEYMRFNANQIADSLQ